MGIYRIRPDTCCFGLCVKCTCRRTGDSQGRRRCRVPFQIREPCAPYNQIADAAITDMWAGFVRECCTKQEVYSVKFPPPPGGRDPYTTTGQLVGAALLVNMLMFEGD